MNKHTATCPNGQIVKRNSANRVYSHCVIAWRESTKAWVVQGWTSRLDLAQKLVNEQNSRFNAHLAGGQKDKDYAQQVWGDRCQCHILEANIA